MRARARVRGIEECVCAVQLGVSKTRLGCDFVNVWEKDPEVSLLGETWARRELEEVGL